MLLKLAQGVGVPAQPVPFQVQPWRATQPTSLEAVEQAAGVPVHWPGRHPIAFEHIAPAS
jgi:hypothetical protein